MSSPTRKLVAASFLILICTFQLPMATEAAVTVEDPQLVKEVQAGGVHIFYTYSLSIDNDGPTLDDVNVYIDYEGSGVKVLQDVVEFGEVPANSVTTSKHTFMVRETLRRGKTPAEGSFDPGELTFDVAIGTQVTISGVVTDMPLSEALVTGKVTRPASGRPIVESGRPIVEVYGTTTDTDGNYTLNVDAVTTDDFLTLRADGTGDQEEATLTSTVGSIGSILDDTADATTMPDVSGIDITHITTAMAVLAEHINGGAITTDAELAAAQAGVDGNELLIMAAVIKAVIDNANIDLPAGVDNTLDLVSNSTIYEPFLEYLETNFPVELSEAISETAANLPLGYDSVEVPGTMYLALGSEFPLFGGSFVFDFEVGGIGSALRFNGRSDTGWAVNVNGEIFVDLVNPPVFESFDFCVYPGQTSIQCRVLSFVDRYTLIRLAKGLTTDQVFALSRTVKTYPDDPLPDEIVQEVVDSNTPVYLAFREDGIVPFQAAELSGMQVGLHYNHQNNDSVGLNNSVLGADMLTFNANGTGVTGRRNFTFGWTIDADGIVDVTFANGDNNRYVRYRVEDVISRTVQLGSMTNGDVATNDSRVIRHDGAAFTNAMLLDRRYQALGSVLDDSFDFSFLFLAGGTGCRKAPIPQALEWESTPENFMDSFLFQLFNDPTIATQRRSFEAIAVVPGILGDRYWVIETLEVSDFTASYVFRDPVVTPGRINSYEFAEDLTGAIDPCAP